MYTMSEKIKEYAVCMFHVFPFDKLRVHNRGWVRASLPNAGRRMASERAQEPRFRTRMSKISVRDDDHA